MTSLAGKSARCDKALGAQRCHDMILYALVNCDRAQSAELFLAIFAVLAELHSWLLRANPAENGISAGSTVRLTIEHHCSALYCEQKNQIPFT